MARIAQRRRELQEIIIIKTLKWKASQLDLMPRVHYFQSEIRNRKTDPSTINQKQERRKDPKMAQRINRGWTSLVAISQGLQRRACEVETKAKATTLSLGARGLEINQQQQSRIPNSSRVTMT